MSRNAIAAILLAALGYFVDIYDLILFSIVRVASLKDIGVASDKLLDTGLLLINMQMTGMLVGGLLWGILGAAGIVGTLCFALALLSLTGLRETFGKDLDYLEPHI